MAPPSRSRAGCLGRDPFAPSPWTPGSVGRLDCGDPSLAGVFQQPSASAGTDMVRHAAPEADIERSRVGDHLLYVPEMNETARELFVALLEDVRARGVPAIVHEAVRTAKRQRMIYAKGRTNAELKSQGYDDSEIAEARSAGFKATRKNPQTGEIEPEEKVAPSWKSGPKGHGGGKAMDVYWIVKGRKQAGAPYKSWQKALIEAADAHGCVSGLSNEWVKNHSRAHKRDPPHVEYFPPKR